jgi:hypothetical protein
MRPLTTRSPFLCVASLVGALSCVPASGAAQSVARPLSWSRFGIGYVANAPNMMAGVSGYVLFRALGGIGLYADAKFDVDSPGRDPYYYPNWTPSQVEDSVRDVFPVDHQVSWRAFDVAVVRPVTPGLMVYAGVGYAQKKRYQSYQDPSKQLGQLGLFWVEAPDLRVNTASAMFGVFMRMSRVLAFQTGFETTPRGFTLGATIKFPPR